MKPTSQGALGRRRGFMSNNTNSNTGLGGRASTSMHYERPRQVQKHVYENAKSATYLQKNRTTTQSYRMEGNDDNLGGPGG